jgi:hypothetical protein
MSIGFGLKKLAGFHQKVIFFVEIILLKIRSNQIEAFLVIVVQPFNLKIIDFRNQK